MMSKIITREDVKEILLRLKDNLPSTKYNVGQKVISELCSKLVEQITAEYYADKMQVPVIPGNHDTDPDVLFKLPNQNLTLEIKVALLNENGRIRFRGGGLTDRTSDYLFIARNKDCTEFFVCLVPMDKSDWIAQKTAYYAPFFDEIGLHSKKGKVLFGNFTKQTKGKRQGMPLIHVEKI